MLGFKSNSIANPVGGSADFDHGIKEISVFKTYSVGDKTFDGEYITKPSDGSNVTISVKDGIATFSYPQTHLYVGVGDQVAYALPSIATTTVAPITTSSPSIGILYLNKKLSSTQWEVHNGTNSIDDLDSVTVVKIDKVFDLLSSAVTNIPTVLGTQDLVSINSVLRLALYTKATTENIASSITIDDSWITDEDHYIRIFVPSDLKTECNSNQRHYGVVTSDRYKIKNTNVYECLILKSSYCEIEGLQIDGNSSPCVLISYASTNLKKSKILNNILYNAYFGIKSTIVPNDNQVVTGNIIYGVECGISMNSCMLNAYNNTIIKFTDTGINLTVATGTPCIRNCLIQKGSTGTTCIYIAS
jgi:hypothetical protein